ncbi:hypothetical protein [Jeongeupia sp. USM3]|uniref:hypothetical protein n=1 Tax=Jeongeupia sp. USM3 TaxID=1906741 RepID=UPI00089DDCA3|nr:hypothetical protein [Jeongeupia sp. USM3]AOY00678.1 hypothetical protein BJP62_09670 [Jeongeupia sp. USM3]
MNTTARRLGTTLAPLIGIAIATVLAVGGLNIARQQLVRKTMLQDAAIRLSDTQLASAADWIAAHRGSGYKQEAGKPWAVDNG